MPVVLGLGNPGRRYERTRHNVGWRVVASLVERHVARDGESTGEYRSWRALIQGKEVDLLVTLAFMNRTGDAFRTWRESHPFELSELLVVTDDVYLPVGTLRLRARGSSGGHRGLESLEGTLGSREYARLRIGVGEVAAEGLRDHVLETPAGEEEDTLNESLKLAADAVECWLGEGTLAAMNRFNRKVHKEASEP